MSLSDYRRKRRFDKTDEPEPGRQLPAGQRALFVVQLHHASRRHYDFRLQVGGALKSWAIPKGPSYDPKIKRMAVEVEDHPLDYARFEGEIPHGEYGGGHVARFDHGVWTTEGDPQAQLAKGHLRFELFGSKLKGGWHLVRAGRQARQPQWLLFKAEDSYASSLEADDLLGDVTPAGAADCKRAGAGKRGKKGLRTVAPPRRRRVDWHRRALALSGARAAALPARPFSPQLATLAATPPQGEQWLHEIKWDGYRILALVQQGKVTLWSRNGQDWTARLPEIRDALDALGLASAALDGEVIAGQGRAQDFNLLQAALAGERQARLSYVLFDLLHLDGVDLARAPLQQRKALLQSLLQAPPPHLAYSAHVPGDGAQALALASGEGFEGILSKRCDQAYRGGRSELWQKVKRQLSEEFAVVGYTAPKGDRRGFGSLLLARPDAAGDWVYAGRVGSGFSEAMLDQLRRRLGDAGGGSPTARLTVDDPALRKATWVVPQLVVEVFYRGIGRRQLLRQPSLKAVRPDKEVADLMPPSAPESARASTAVTHGKRRRHAAMTPSWPELSSPDKLVFPQQRLRKKDIWDYYMAVQDDLLAEIGGRPLSVIRCPSGIGKPCFFQKHHMVGLSRVDSVRLAEEDGQVADYLVVNDAAGLMELVQMNALEFHPWGARADHPDLADRLIFDLDPGPDVPFAEVKQAARDIRRLLARLELQSFLRVSGGKGLHLVVPLRPACDWFLVRHFAKSFATALAQSEPDRFLATAQKRLRRKRIFVDYLRNGRGATAVASYSLRGRPGAPVAMPIAWGELGALQRADAFTLERVLAKLKRRRKDPWQGIATIRQDLSRCQSPD